MKLSLALLLVAVAVASATSTCAPFRAANCNPETSERVDGRDDSGCPISYCVRKSGATTPAPTTAAPTTTRATTVSKGFGSKFEKEKEKN